MAFAIIHRSPPKNILAGFFIGKIVATFIGYRMEWPYSRARFRYCDHMALSDAMRYHGTDHQRGSGCFVVTGCVSRLTAINVTMPTGTPNTALDIG